MISPVEPPEANLGCGKHGSHHILTFPLYKMNGLSAFLSIHCLIALGTTLPPLVSDQPLLHTGPGWHGLHPSGRRESVGIRMPVQILVVRLASWKALGWVTQCLWVAASSSVRANLLCGLIEGTV